MNASGREISVNIPQALMAGREHFQAGRLTEARAIFGQVLEREPRQADALQFLGLIAHREQREEEAVALLHQAIDVAPDSPAYRCNLGAILKDLGRLDEAITCYRQALEIRPDHVLTQNNLGNALQEQGELDQAIACYEGALRAKPDYVEALSNLGTALKAQGSLEEAVASHERALELRSDYAEAHCNLGIALAAQGKMDEAIASFDRALALRPGYAEASSNLGSALQAQGRLDEAVATFRAALEAAPLLATAHSNLAQALVKQKKLEEALSHYGQALAIDPRQITANDELPKLLGHFVPAWHVPMMNDIARNEAYFAALRAAIDPGSRVLEIGTGSGLLAMMAASLGAARVTTCEAEPLIAATANKVIAANGLSEKITVVAKKSTELAVGTELAERADILVTEIFSSELLGENAIASIEDAKRRLLAPGARIIPASAGIMIALFGGEDIAANLAVGECCGFDLRQFNAIVPRKQVVGRADLNIELLSDDLEAFRFDFEIDSIFPEAKRSLKLPVARAGLCYGIIQWIRLQMDVETVFENHPSIKSPASGWQHTVYLLPEPTELRAGQVAVIAAAHNRTCPWFALDRLE